MRDAHRYAPCMARQLVTRIDDELAAAIDGLVADGIYRNRSEVVRAGVHQLVRARRHRHDIEMYRRFPQTEEELSGIDDDTRRLIDDEPW